MAYYVSVDGEIVLIATRKSDVDDLVRSMKFDPTIKSKKVTVSEE